jgi:hypothetical protein
MSTIINATTTNGVVIQPDNSGSLVLQTNSGTTALTIDTSQRAAFVAGTAALPAITTTGDTNTGMFFPAADTIAFAEGGAETMRIDSSGNVGIGTVANAGYAKLAINASSASSYPTYSNPAAGGFNGAFFASTLNSADSYTTMLDIGGVTGNTDSLNGGSAIRFLTQPRVSTFAPLERMRIDSSGNVLVGTASGTGYKVRIKSGNGDQLLLDNAGETYTQLIFANNGNNKADLYLENSTTRFYIRCNGTGGVYLASGGTSWTSASDARVKDIIEPIDNAVQKLESWQTVIGKYKTDEEGTRRPFLIAQDVLATFPEAVDTTNEEEYGLRYQDTIPLLVAAIQEQQTIINDLKARIETLEAK